MKLKVLQTLVVIIGIIFLSQCSDIKKIEVLTNNPSQYQKVEMDIYLKAEWENPNDAEEISLDMIVHSPSGNEQKVPCFYFTGESGEKSQWKVRYTPAEVGEYRYHFVLSQKNETNVETKAANFSVNESDGKGILHVNDLWTLRYDNGELFRGIGENICWESRDFDDSKYFQKLHEESKFNYEYMIRKLTANGGNFFRTWMIYWNLPVDWKMVKNNQRYTNSETLYNDSGTRKMDRLVELCDSLNVHIMVALESHAGMMGQGWELNSYNIKNGGTAITQEEFFTLESAKKQYKNKLRYMVARYGYSPAIGAWEFFNEIDNVMYNRGEEFFIKDEIITQWHDEMSTYLKEIDPYEHIVTTSVSHREVAGMYALKNIDINQRHIYRQTDKIPNLIKDGAEKYDKPFVIGEFGYEWDWSKNFNDFAEDMDGDFKKGLWYGLFNPTPILPMSWWWEFFEDRDIMSYFKNVKEISDEMLVSGNGEFQQITIESNQKSLTIFGVQCGEKIYTYIISQDDNEKSVDLIYPGYNSLISGLQYFDCETGNYHPVKDENLSGNSLKMQDEELPLKTGVVLIISLKQE